MSSFLASLPFFLSFHLLLLLSHSSASLTCAEPTQDKPSFLAFLAGTPYSSRVRWDLSVSACSWVGVVCDLTNSSVVNLRLPGVGLLGSILPNTLGRLSSLRVLSIRSNRIFSLIHADLFLLTHLRSLYLRDNNFSRADLSSNGFSGPIPFGLTNLSRLTRLYLQNNNFTGRLPSINQDRSITSFNVSNNALNGSIPSTLTKFPESTFVGNLALCGGPLPSCTPSSPHWSNPALFSSYCYFEQEELVSMTRGNVF